MRKFLIAFFAFELFGNATLVFQMSIQVSFVFVFSSTIVRTVDGAVFVIKFGPITVHER